MKERLEHADHGAHPRMIGHHGDVAEIVPVPEPERAVVPQRLKLKAREILPDDIRAPRTMTASRCDRRQKRIGVRFRR